MTNETHVLNQGASPCCGQPNILKACRVKWIIRPLHNRWSTNGSLDINMLSPCLPMTVRGKHEKHNCCLKMSFN